MALHVVGPPVRRRIEPAAIFALPWILLVAALGLLTLTAEARSSTQEPQTLVDEAVVHFEAGRFAEAVSAFDRLALLVPSVKPELWQRGIALYYLGRYAECAAQFAAFHALSPTDLENASWHFLCTARAESPEKARAAMLGAGPDRRILRAEVFEMLGGRITPADLVARSSGLPIALFYAHLYAGLYFDAIGDRAQALAHLTEAAADRYLEYGGFMNTVAHVHRDLLRQGRR